MRSGQHGWVLLTAAVLATGAAARAEQQASTTTAARADSAAAAATADSLLAIPRYIFAPLFTNQITGDVTSIGMANAFSTTITTPWGSIFNFRLAADEKNYRSQNKHDDNKTMSGNLLHTFRPELTGSVLFSDSRVFSRTVAVGGGAQNFIVNDRTVTSGLAYVRKFEDLGLNWTVNGSASEGDRTFKTDRTLVGGAFGGFSYNLMDDRVRIVGRGGVRQTAERSKTDLSTFDGLGGAEDSVVAGARVLVTDSISVRFDYTDFHGDRDFADQARGSLGSQIGGAENVLIENEVRDTKNTTVSMQSSFLGSVSLSLTAYHDDRVADYAVQKDRSSKNVGDGFKGEVSYFTPWRTQATVSFEGSSTLNDLGPQSVASLTDKRRLARIALHHGFTKTLLMDLSGSTQLAQSFYVDYKENPRDRDQLDTSVNLRITSQPFPPVSASISLAYSATDFISIDATQSENNRKRDLYEFRPSFTYLVRPWLTIVQNYGVAIEYTDYTYKATSNYLDRNLTFSNEFRFQPMRDVRLRFEYGLILHDTGSYLPDPETKQDVLTVDREDRRDRTTLRVDYALNQRLTIFAENLYSRYEDHTIISDSRSISTDGLIRIGTSGNYDWGKSRTLKFSLARVRRFSPYGGDVEKNYWDARSELSYPF